MLTVTLALSPALERLLARVLGADDDEWAALNRKIDTMAKTLDDILGAQKSILDTITEDTSLDNSIAAILDSDRQTIADLKTQLDVAIAANDPAKMQEVSDNMDAILAAMVQNRDAAKAAVTANTPAST